MADDYTVELEGHTFAASPACTFVGERGHRLDEHPVTHRVTTYTIELEKCRVLSANNTPDGAQEALGTFLTACLHKSIVPTYLKIKDSSAATIDEIGNINTSVSGWEELQVTRFAMAPGTAQLKAGAEFSLTLTVRRVFADANGMVDLSREWSTETGANGLEVRTQRTRVTMQRGTSVPTTTSWLIALVRLACPAGWGRTVGNTTLGAAVSYPFYPQQHVAEFVSQVSQIGGGVVAPTGAGEATERTIRRHVRELGLVEVTHEAEALGASEGDDYLDDQEPAGSTGAREHDKGRKIARGSWRTWEPIETALGGKVYRIERTFDLTSGGQPVVEKRRTGGYLPALCRGAATAWRLRETIRAEALGVAEWPDVPTLPALGAPWVLDAEAPGVPRLVERGGELAQHRWERTTVRDYVWDGDAPPLEDPAQQRLFVRRYERGEDGLVLS